MYDDKVREFVEGVGLENIGKRLVNNREKVEFVKPEMSLEKLLKYGQFLVDEQARHGLLLLLMALPDFGACERCEHMTSFNKTVNHTTSVVLHAA